MMIDWIGSTGRDDLLEQLAQDMAEITDRTKHEIEDRIVKAIDEAYSMGFKDGDQEV